ncbi:MAG: PleD family two-component system response regulator [Gammaproteobacteria bacterium]
MPVILIVDDSPTEVHVIKSALEEQGYETLSAESGERGVEMARESKPDLILMDVVMPGLNGFQATRQLSKDPVTSEIPVIMVTTKNQKTDRIWGMRQGAVDYIVKPFSAEDLLEKTAAALA